MLVHSFLFYFQLFNYKTNHIRVYEKWFEHCKQLKNNVLFKFLKRITGELLKM